MPWGQVRGHDRIVDSLRRAFEQGRFPHAFLFVGPEGVGKHRFARTLAQALLCEQRAASDLTPCGTCNACRMVEADTHPDLLTVSRPEDKHELPIEALRRLCQDLGLTPSRGSRRVAIIDDADDLSTEAANAFLKTLEEPPPGAVLILIGTAAELQLDTIRSRCRLVRFEPLSPDDLLAIIEEHGLASDRSEAERLALLGEGSVGRALGLADPEFAAYRGKLLEEIARGFDAPGLAKRVEAFISEAGKESAARRERARLLLGELARFFRQVLWRTTGLDAPCPVPEDRRSADSLGERLDPDQAVALADRCLEADYHLVRKAHIGLALDALFHDLQSRLSQPAGRSQ